MENSDNFKPSGGQVAKFVLLSLLGIFLFLGPIPDGEGAFNIPMGIIIDWLNANIFSAVPIVTDTMGGAGTLDLRDLIALIAITLSLILTILAWTVKPGFIENNPKVKECFRVAPVYFITKVVAAVFIWMIFLQVGPPQIIASFTGDVIITLVRALVTIFIVLIPLMTLVTDFGLMEFIGTLIRKAVRVLFTIPGRASVDLMASWFGSSVASLLITRGQHERGFYNDREASVVAVNFSFVSLPFIFIVVSTIGIREFFFPFLGITYLICFILGIVMPRLPPLRGIRNDYLPEVGKQIQEEVPEGVSTVRCALDSAYRAASKPTVGGIAKRALNNWMDIFANLLGCVMAWGTIGVMLAELTPVFTWIGMPFGLLLQLLQVPEAAAFAHTAVVGFIDMFLPALMLGGAPVETQFILGVLSIVQIIYLAETGALIIKSRMPLGVGKLAIIFVMRTVIAIPLVVLFTRLFVNF